MLSKCRVLSKTGNEDSLAKKALMPRNTNRSDVRRTDTRNIMQIIESMLNYNFKNMSNIVNTQSTNNNVMSKKPNSYMMEKPNSCIQL